MPRKICLTCEHFRKTYTPKQHWTERVSEAKKTYPGISDLAATALANEEKIWPQEESGKGFCTFHGINDEIPNHFSCNNYLSV